MLISLMTLYEQSGERDGHIIGYTNWRLAGLQKAIKEGRVPTFKTLTATTTETAAVGDVVTISGKVHLDRDFGAGYKYDGNVPEGTFV